MLPEEIIVRPVVTEKSNDELQLGKYTFEVNKKATKVQIAKAVEKLRLTLSNSFEMSSTYQCTPADFSVVFIVILVFEISSTKSFYLRILSCSATDILYYPSYLSISLFQLSSHEFID